MSQVTARDFLSQLPRIAGTVEIRAAQCPPLHPPSLQPLPLKSSLTRQGSPLDACRTLRVLAGAEGFDFSRDPDPGPESLDGWRLFTLIHLARSPLQILVERGAAAVRHYLSKAGVHTTGFNPTGLALKM